MSKRTRKSLIVGGVITILIAVTLFLAFNSTVLAYITQDGRFRVEETDSENCAGGGGGPAICYRVDECVAWNDASCSDCETWNFVEYTTNPPQ